MQMRLASGSRNTVRAVASVAYLLAQPLHVALSQLLAAHQALDPAVQGRNCRGLRGRSRRELHWLGHLHVLHVGVHGCAGWTGGGAAACCDRGEQSRGCRPRIWRMTCVWAGRLFSRWVIWRAAMARSIVALLDVSNAAAGLGQECMEH